MKGQAQTPKLLDQVRDLLRLHHYSIHTERSYTDWIKRYIHFHPMRSREDLADGERKIETFLTDLAVNGKVAASTQNQAMNALVFLYLPYALARKYLSAAKEWVWQYLSDPCAAAGWPGCAQSTGRSQPLSIGFAFHLCVSSPSREPRRTLAGPSP
jgi:hypothetical protein